MPMSTFSCGCYLAVKIKCTVLDPDPLSSRETKANRNGGLEPARAERMAPTRKWLTKPTPPLPAHAAPDFPWISWKIKSIIFVVTSQPSKQTAHSEEPSLSESGFWQCLVPSCFNRIHWDFMSDQRACNCWPLSCVSGLGFSIIPIIFFIHHSQSSVSFSHPSHDPTWIQWGKTPDITLLHPAVPLYTNSNYPAPLSSLAISICTSDLKQYSIIFGFLALELSLQQQSVILCCKYKSLHSWTAAHVVSLNCIDHFGSRFMCILLTRWSLCYWQEQEKKHIDWHGRVMFLLIVMSEMNSCSVRQNAGEWCVAVKRGVY